MTRLSKLKDLLKAPTDSYASMLVTSTISYLWILFSFGCAIHIYVSQRLLTLLVGLSFTVIDHQVDECYECDWC